VKDAFFATVRRCWKTALNFMKNLGGTVLLPLWKWLRRVFAKDTAPNLVLVTTLIAAVAAAGLGVLHTVTEERIGAAHEEAFESFIASAFGPEKYLTPSAFGENVYELFHSHNGDRAGFLVRITLRGTGGPVRLAVEVSVLREVLDVKAVSHRETGELTAYKERAAAEALKLFEGEVR
jgi:Na+-translocating ferredoxin:NAD+ oxidoreductase RnfG subunit